MLITKTQLREVIKEELVRTIIIREARQYQKIHGRIDEGFLDLPIVKKAMSMGKGALIATALLAAAPAQATTATDAYGAEEMTSAEYQQAIEDRGTVVHKRGDKPAQAPHLTDVGGPPQASPGWSPERGYDPAKIPSDQKAPLASVEGTLDAQQLQRLKKFEQIDQKIKDLNDDKEKASGSALNKIEKQIEHYIEMEQKLLKDVVLSHEDAEQLEKANPDEIDQYLKDTFSPKTRKAIRGGGTMYDVGTKARRAYKVKQ